VNPTAVSPVVGRVLVSPEEVVEKPFELGMIDLSAYVALLGLLERGRPLSVLPRIWSISESRWPTRTARELFDHPAASDDGQG
jgi:hypothetical protein